MTADFDNRYRMAESPGGDLMHFGPRTRVYNGFSKSSGIRGYAVRTMCDQVHRVAGVLPFVPTSEEIESGEAVRRVCGDCTRYRRMLPDGVKRVRYGPPSQSGPSPEELGFEPDTEGVAVRIDLDEYPWKDLLEKEAALR